jgi:hypothetical protein
LSALFPNRLTKEQFLLFGLDEPSRAVQQFNGSDFLSGIRTFSEFGALTRHFVEGAIPYYVNEFWTAGQRQAHSLHEVSYRACFKAQLPEFFISRLTKVGETVHDPFMGRGTTPIQAGLMGRKPSGSDVNPLSVLLARPRLRPPHLSDVARRLTEVPWETGDLEHDELLAFYHPQTLRHLNALRLWLSKTAPIEDVNPDPVIDWIRMVSINRLTGHSPGFFSGRTMPPNQAVSVEAQRRMNERSGSVPPPRNVIEIILKKSRSLLSDGTPPAHERTQFFVRPAHQIPEISDQSVSLVVTSPPFLDTVQYADDNWLRCWFAGIAIDQVDIAMHKTESAWTEFVRDSLTEQARILRPGGHVAFEVGEVRGGKVLLERLVWQAAQDLPFERLGVIVNQQEFTKTANCWGVSNNAKGTNTNRIVLLRKL